MIKTILGDFVEAADKIQDSTIDLLLTDPPYNISAGRSIPVWIDKKTGGDRNTIHSHNFSNQFDDKWDEVDHEDFINQMRTWCTVWEKKLKKGAAFAIFMSDRYISHLWHCLERSRTETQARVGVEEARCCPI